MVTTIRPNPYSPILIDDPVIQDTLTQSEYEAFKAALPSWWDWLIAILLRNTGFRVNELLNLEVHHCALNGPVYIIYVQRSKKRGTKEYEPLDINPGLGVQVRDYIKGNAYTQTERRFGNAPSERDSRRITARGFRFVFDKTGKQVLGRAISPKDFRSFFVQAIVDGGVSMAMAF